jgi:hypothetical protein
VEENNEKKQNPFFELSKVASTTECTGLMPALPQNEDEDESYASLYATHDLPVDGNGLKAGPPICNKSTR